MLFSSVFAWLLVAFAIVVSLPALWLLSLGLWPRRTARLQRLARQGLQKSFWLGLIALVIGVVIVSVLSKIPQMGVVAVMVGGLWVTAGFLGSCGIAALVGKRLWPEAQSWRQMKQGGLTLVCCALLPIVGWVFILPLIVVLGWGFQMRLFFQKKEVTSPVAESGEVSATPATAEPTPGD